MGYTLILYLVVTLGMQAWQYYYTSNVLTSDIFQLSLVVTTRRANSGASWHPSCQKISELAEIIE